MGDVVLGFDNVDDYVKKSPYFGAIVGRVANRIRNATFVLDGKTYKLNANNAPHHLHGGTKGWDKVIWTAEPMETKDGPALKLTHVSPDGEENYPGTVTATATYTLTNDNALKVEMTATTDKTTIVNMAHHTYWNLAGDGTILDHELTIPADKYTPGDPMVPDGTMKPVKGTPFDFTTAKPIGSDLKAAGGKPVGYDHNWVVNGDPHAMRAGGQAEGSEVGPRDDHHGRPARAAVLHRQLHGRLEQGQGRSTRCSTPASASSRRSSRTRSTCRPGRTRSS